MSNKLVKHQESKELLSGKQKEILFWICFIVSFGCDVDKPCPGFRLRWLLSAERQLALREPGCPPRTRLEESETGPANAAGSVFLSKKRGREGLF